jgi:DNA-binding transcriptional ArsR family regulator|tara:strand:+ start:248 stop:541 length:294 start_codon:yes stop_codon:yes gene_type:complete
MEFDTVMKSFNVLGQKARLQIMIMLVEKGDDGLCPCDMLEPLGIANSSLTFHLKELENAGLVYKQKKGQFIFYYAKCDVLKSLGEFLINKCPNCDEL